MCVRARMHVCMCIGEGDASGVRVTRDETTEDGLGETLVEGDRAKKKTTVRPLKKKTTPPAHRCHSWEADVCPCPQVRQILPAYLRLAHGGGAESGGRGGDAKRKAAYARANASEFQGKVSMGSFGVGVRGRTGRKK